MLYRVRNIDLAQHDVIADKPIRDLRHSLRQVNLLKIPVHGKILADVIGAKVQAGVGNSDSFQRSVPKSTPPNTLKTLGQIDRGNLRGGESLVAYLLYCGGQYDLGKFSTMTECVSTDFLETFGKHQGVHPYWGVIESIVSHATERGGEVEFPQGKGLVKSTIADALHVFGQDNPPQMYIIKRFPLVLFAVTVEGIGRHGIVLQLGTLQVDGGEITIERRMKQGLKICAVDRAVDHQGVYLLFLVAQHLCQLAATGRRHLLPRELMFFIRGLSCTSSFLAIVGVVYWFNKYFASCS